MSKFMEETIISNCSAKLFESNGRRFLDDYLTML